MKKITLSLLLLVVMIIGLTGCSNTEINKASSKATKEEIKGNYDVFESMINKKLATQAIEVFNRDGRE